ncbi:Uncharacterised protein [Candidatus Tiddalikarchaeum anstoanum]|nr:Uncharacterised protein [Candidatus Tiddalikarchaeum anstoanum]
METKTKEEVLKENEQIKHTEDVPTECLKILQDEKLFDLLHKEWNKHIVGEILPREIIFAVALGGSLCLNAQKTSNNLIVNSKSGSGKDHVTTEVIRLISGEEERWFKRTRISKTAFTYWHNSFFEPEWTWNGKIFYGEDVSSDVLNCEVFKVMSSGGSHSTIVKDQKALTILINGKPSIIITAANATLQDELLRRFAVIRLNETKEQDDLIIKHQAELAMTGIQPQYDDLVKKSLLCLKPVKVIIPYAEEFEKVFEKMHANIIIRTNFNRFVDMIKYSTVIHQFQRDRASDGSIYAKPEDYDKAVDWFYYMFTNQQLLPLTNDQQRLLKLIQELSPEANVSDIISEVTFAGRTWVYTNLNILAEKGFLIKGSKVEENSYQNRKSDVYTAIKQEELKLPYYFDLDKN